MKRPIVNAILLILTLGLAWACYQSIHSDIAFDEVKAQREQLVKNRLWEIRSAEEQFKMVNGHFCGTIDSLIDWVKNEKAIDHVVKEGELSDDQLEAGMTESQAVRQGLIKRDTVWVSAAERLGIANPDSMRYVPVGREGALIQLRKKDAFNLRANEWENLVEFRASLDDYMYGVDDKRVKNLKADLKKLSKNKADLFEDNADDEKGEWYGLRVGDLQDAGTKMAGNWE